MLGGMGNVIDSSVDVIEENVRKDPLWEGEHQRGDCWINVMGVGALAMPSGKGHLNF